MIPFQLDEPDSLAEAQALLDPDDPMVRPWSGGTGLMLMMRSGLFRPQRLVSLRGIESQYREVAVDGDGTLTVGATATLRTLERHQHAMTAFPVLASTLRRLSNVRVRNVASLGGHLAHGDPHMDLPAVLTALEAHVTLSGAGGERRQPVEALYQGYFETTLAADDLITALKVPPLGNQGAAYLKCTTRSADDWPALGVAAVVALDGRAISSSRIVVGAATDRPTVLEAAAEAVSGAEIEPGPLAQLPSSARARLTAAIQSVALRGDSRGSAAYKQELLKVFAARAIAAAAADALSRPSAS